MQRKILIVDDEVLIAEDLMDILNKYGFRNIEMAHDKKSAVSMLNEFKPDIVLLDIRMEKETDGLELGEYINEKLKMPFIYITAHSDIEMIKEIVKTKPVAYITKPYKNSEIYAALLMAEGVLSNVSNSFLTFKDGYATVKVLVDDIHYVESNGNYIDIYTKQKRYTLRNSLEWFKQNVPTELFYQTQRSFVVNISKITKTTGKSVFIDTLEIPVSRGNQFKLS
jgi:two-component system, LytTR family, response regulator LytT